MHSFLKLFPCLEDLDEDAHSSFHYMWFKEKLQLKNINNNKTIIGISIPNSKIQVKIWQYANQFFSNFSGLGKKCFKILPKIIKSHRCNN